MRRPLNIRAASAGFTLLEIMVALAILAISLVALITAGNKAGLVISDSARLTRAVTLAREEMERLYMEPAFEAGSSELLKRKDYPEFRWKREVEATPFTGAWEVTVRVFEAAGGETEPDEDLFTLIAYIRK